MATKITVKTPKYLIVNELKVNKPILTKFCHRNNRNYIITANVCLITSLLTKRIIITRPITISAKMPKCTLFMDRDNNNKLKIIDRAVDYIYNILPFWQSAAKWLTTSWLKSYKTLLLFFTKAVCLFGSQLSQQLSTLAITCSFYLTNLNIIIATYTHSLNREYYTVYCRIFSIYANIT